jgi:NADPH-dependent ferric siderophore reductase
MAIQLLTAGPVPGERLVEALRDAPLPAGAQCWVAGEAHATRRARGELIERGVDRGPLSTRGYWRQGEANHTDHDMGED